MYIFLYQNLNIMAAPFVFGKIAEGNNFIDREKDTKRLAENFMSLTNTILISPRRWGKSSLVHKDVTEALEQYKLRPDSLIIELTESGYVENSPVVRKLWEQLKDRGVLIAIDDFGTGYSNLQSIGNMMPDIIKLDRGFTVKALNNNYEHQLMNQIIRLIHSVDLKVCVEGVETMEELTEIERLSADCIQGYYYGKPVCASDFEEQHLKTLISG